MKKTVYDTHYKKLDYFGEPYSGLKTFFENHEPKGMVLDLGCGQGRDSIFISKCGYDVLGLDVSEIGINQLNLIARENKLSLEGRVADIYKYKITEEYDIVLLDSIFHFYKNDVEKEAELITRIAREIKMGGIICNFMLKGQKREKIFKDILSGLDIKFEVLHDEYTSYPEFDSIFHMYIIRKLSSL